MKTLLLIDANSLIHRCFHALPPLTNSKGEPTGALYGISNILLKIISSKKPDFAAALFDRPEPTFRKEKFSDYKIHRPKAADELVSQIILAHHLFEDFSIKTFELPGYEADDLIGTFATKFKNEKDIRVIILTGDLDSLQLIEDGKISVETFKKGISETATYNEEAVFERYGIRPDQMIDYKALVGDASDNIPGVSGIGPKTASEILKKYETLDIFFKKGQGEKSYAKIKENEDKALLSRELAEIITSVPIEAKLKDLEFSPDQEKIKKFFIENDFSSLLKRVTNIKTDHQTKNVSEQKPAQVSFDFKEELPKDIILIEESSTLSEKELPSTKNKIGFDLKSIFKKTAFLPPFFDISVGLGLLGISIENWREAALKIFKMEVPEKEFLYKSFVWLSKKIKDKKLEKVFYEIEMPLVPVLAEMEKKGVLINKKELKTVQKDLNGEVKEKEKNILKKIGVDLNLNSPKQLLEYFQKQGLKIKSTSADTLDKIKESHPIVKEILEYREFFKIKTTYLDAFEKLIKEDGRIHPTFMQLGAATGRLSCQNPNLQNIPQESSWSKKIRNVFITPEGFQFVSFDYSQIELRVLASLTEDKNMVSAFKKGEDIHSLTAQKIFGIKKEEVAPHQRRLAKVLNFGIIYGMGYRAFSQTAQIPSDQAKEFIQKYFDEFSTIKNWQADILKKARETGVSANINGRFRDVSAINSPNQFLASEAERAAINMPSQSLAADILKLAMSKSRDYIIKNKLEEKVYLILSIHDELIFEIEDNLIQKGKIIEDLKEIMESAYELNVPLKVETKIGTKWGELS